MLRSWRIFVRLVLHDILYVTYTLIVLYICGSLYDLWHVSHFVNPEILWGQLIEQLNLSLNKRLAKEKFIVLEMANYYNSKSECTFILTYRYNCDDT